MRTLLFCFAVFVFAMFPFATRASHVMGADMAYVCQGSNHYKITVTLYRDCSGIAAPNVVIINYSSAICGIGPFTDTLVQISQQEVTGLCPAQLPQSTCNGGVLPGVQRVLYEGVITLPAPCIDWVVSFAECCRNAAVTNLQSANTHNLFAYVLINNTAGICDTSPVFTTLAVPYVCVGYSFSYNLGTVDAEGDSLIYKLIQPLDAQNTPIPYTGGFGLTNPLIASSFTFDTITGTMTFKPSALQSAVVAILVSEYRNGVLIGSVMRDIQILAINCSWSTPPISSGPVNFNGGLLNSSTGVIEACANSNITFDINVSDPGGDSLYLFQTANGTISNYAITYSGADSARGVSFLWTPTPADTGTHTWYFRASDGQCASYPAEFNFTFHIYNDARAHTSDTAHYCPGIPVMLQGAGGTTFHWSPAAGLSNTLIHNPLASPVTSTLYKLTTDCGVDSVYVVVVPSFTVHAGNDTTACNSAPVQLNVSVNPPGSYTFAWQPATGLSNSHFANPVASPATTTQYVVTATAASTGCTQKDTITVTALSTSAAPVVSATADSVCQGGVVHLAATLQPATCGLVANIGCSGTSSVYTVGSLSATLNQGTPYNGLWEDNRSQYLVLASELHAAGVTTAAFITQLAFNVSAKSSTMPYTDFVIRIGCTTETALQNSFSATPLFVVSGPHTVSTVQGWNTHVFDIPYAWDGASNLLIEICFDNTGFSDRDGVWGTSTSFASMIYDYTDAAHGCMLNTPAQAATSTRPVMQFGVCALPATGTPIQWLPATGVTAPTDYETDAVVTHTTTYVAQLGTAGCHAQASVTVVAVPPPTVSFSGLDTAYLITAAAATLVGVPPGGTFSGAAVSGNIFDPAAAGAGGPYTVTYHYADNSTTLHCTDSFSRMVFVHDTIPIDTTGDTTSVLLLSSGGAMLQIFPNPNNGEFRITAPALLNGEPAELKIYDALGATVFTRDKQPFDDKLTLTLPPGVYVVRLFTEKRVFEGRVVIR